VARAPFDLALFLTNLGDTVRCQIDYAADLFDATTVRRILDQLRLVLDTGIAAPQQPLAQLPHLTGAESRQLTAWQDGGPAPAAELLPGVAKGHRGPVCDDLGEVDGPELDRRTEAVAAALNGIGVGPGQLVGVHLPRSTDAVVAMLGVLRVGAGYVPLDPEQPAARSAAIAADARVSALISRSAIPALPLTTPTVLVDQLDRTAVAASVAAVAAAPDDIAYVLFTSGSTGRPKGCVIEHRAIANTVAWFVRDLAITAADRLSWFGSPGFDISCVEVWPALRVGASLHVVPEDVRLDPVRLREWLVATAITIAVVPTPMGELLLDLDWSGGEPAALRRLVVGGDRLRRGGSVELPFQVTNIYGPTEATVVSTWAHLVNGAEGYPPIGRPVPGTWARVLDEQGRPVGVGVPGELYLGGAQLARGYLSAPQETAQRFVPHPDYGPAFRTGDVVRWRDDGQLEFLRRLDQQVQIRGFRVEPGEVEYHLRGLDGVQEAAVRAWTDPNGDAYLAGYVVPTHAAVGVGALAQTLAGLLPDYLIPGAWMLLPELPMTDSGKLDRAALPRPSGADHAVAGTLVPPASALERRLHDIWCGELGLTTVSVESTFAELGGHSLAAIRLLNRVRTALGNTVGVLAFFRAPTIRAMARLLADGPSPVGHGNGGNGNGNGNGGTVAGDPVRVRGTL
jgi:amino acid adenylation domain-containing protein